MRQTLSTQAHALFSRTMLENNRSFDRPRSRLNASTPFGGKCGRGRLGIAAWLEWDAASPRREKAQTLPPEAASKKDGGRQRVCAN
jgi:hypothetical protein